MLQAVAGRRAAVLPAALALILCPAAAGGADGRPAGTGTACPDPLDEVNQPLDPSAPLEEWRDLGVDWPDMEAEQGDVIPDLPSANVADAAAARTYTYRIEGLDNEDVTELLAQFRQLSTLEQYRERAGQRRPDRPPRPGRRRADRRAAARLRLFRRDRAAPRSTRPAPTPSRSRSASSRGRSTASPK